MKKLQRQIQLDGTDGSLPDWMHEYTVWVDCAGYPGHEEEDMVLLRKLYPTETYRIVTVQSE